MITGAAFIGSREVQTTRRFAGRDAASGEPLSPDVSCVSTEEVAAACEIANQAFVTFSETDPETRALFLEACADAILDIGDELITRTMAETGLPRGRLEGERGRTVGQLRLFARVVRRGDWVDATIDPALPERSPSPRPDLRRRNIGVGPVAVFGASNFPLAFSVAGGDTASAFAAGCPVIVKGHPAHPGAGELVARAVVAAVAESGLHPGVFSYLPGAENDLGAALGADPRIRSIAFTGSRAGGLALQAIALARPEPIPVHAEMSSVNPVILFPGALASRADALAAAFVQSLTLGAGQFCTNPGLLFAIESPALERFIASAAEALARTPAAIMLTDTIADSYQADVAALAKAPVVSTLARGAEADTLRQTRAAFFSVTGDTFVGDAALAREVFGPSSLLVRCANASELRQAVSALDGQLTATLHLDPPDEPLARELMPVLEHKVGRILANDWPTGVEVCDAMVHGGPYPATTDNRTTSVGSLAIARFLRPVCYQSLPEALLPKALRADNPLRLQRRVNGALTLVH